MTKENASAAGPRNGAENACEASQLPEKDAPKTSASATLKYASDAHQWAARLLAAALTLEDFGGWAAASALWAARLTARARASLAYAALRSLEPEQAEMTAATVLRAAGAPMPPFLRGMEEARFWASLANRAELKAFALASFEAMAPHDQTAFLRHISEIEVAA
ncbi:hypothetical protein M2324_001005 [Rhodovulum sulfidophilum]|uniref:hypothetical protein n=1 Tax=Rhodovulum sulfidophilum TaxID=35806 RepID=UPI000B2E0060|nr:hypothetical protein [Rhodovulum sulfidophilum]MCW2302621.1 hypothetical protein [Rhodovulum sulfidophilum]